MKLLPQDSLVKTGPVDEAAWVYRPFLGQIARLRFRMIVRLLGNACYGRLLEIGYGSGILLPELGEHCEELYGIDPHAMPDTVSHALGRHGVRAVLKTAAAEAIPFTDHFFDAVVAVSALEFVTDLETVCREIKRILKPEGRFFFVTPGTSKALDFGLKLLTGNDAKKDFGNRRELVLPLTTRHFAFEKTLTAPPLLGAFTPLYRAVRCRVR
jgi:ubiquinone/menaquinone biosynthesis C-methylase UbiE